MGLTRGHKVTRVGVMDRWGRGEEKTLGEKLFCFRGNLCYKMDEGDDNQGNTLWRIFYPDLGERRICVFPLSEDDM